jgi:uncharacterized protein (DUF58 family)
VCFVLSDWIDSNWDKPLKLAMMRHDMVAARVADRAELSLPDLGLVEMEDAETGQIQIIDSASKAVRSAYEQKQTKQREKTKKRLRQLGCDLVDVYTDEDYVTPLVQFFRTRSARLRGGK